MEWTTGPSWCQWGTGIERTNAVAMEYAAEASLRADWCRLALWKWKFQTLRP